MSHTLTPDLAAKFASVALGHVTREWPNKMDHVLTGPEDVKGPRQLHPIFYGSFDWHSAVHSHWLLARIYRRFPEGAQAANIRKLLDEQFTPQNVAGEVAYLARPSARGFERPYGWGWALMLQGELARHETEEGRRWAAALKPLADAFDIVLRPAVRNDRKLATDFVRRASAQFDVLGRGEAVAVRIDARLRVRRQRYRQAGDQRQHHSTC